MALFRYFYKFKWKYFMKFIVVSMQLFYLVMICCPSQFFGGKNWKEMFTSVNIFTC
jgi:hypothetical protein